MKKNRILFFVLIAGLILLDQLSKCYIRAEMIPGETIPVISGIFHITFVQNDGAAFSILQGRQILLILVSLLMMSVLLIWMIRDRKTGHPLFLLSLCLLVSGGAGNFIDRLRLGYVVDFLDFRIWPVFNLADCFVCLGCGLLAVYVLFVEPGRRAGKTKEPEGTNGRKV